MGRSGGRQALLASVPGGATGQWKEDQTEHEAWAGTVADHLGRGGCSMRKRKGTREKHMECWAAP